MTVVNKTEAVAPHQRELAFVPPSGEAWIEEAEGEIEGQELAFCSDHAEGYEEEIMLSFDDRLRSP